MTTTAPTTPERWLEAPAATRTLDGRVPAGPIQEKWDEHRFEMKLVNPANKRRFHVLVVGSGLAEASAAASLAELGYRVSCFCYQDSPRRDQSLAPTGASHAAHKYQHHAAITFPRLLLT